MAKTDFKITDEYIDTFDSKDVEGLKAIRNAIVTAVSDFLYVRPQKSFQLVLSATECGV